MNTLWTQSEADEIIALEIGDAVYFGQLAIEKAVQNRSVKRIFSRAVFRFMAAMDLGTKWKEWADTQPTLFLKSDYDSWSKNE